jgi:hypothetical protein
MTREGKSVQEIREAIIRGEFQFIDASGTSQEKTKQR